MAVRFIILFTFIILLVNGNPVRRSVEDSVAEESKVVFLPHVITLPHLQKEELENTSSDAAEGEEEGDYVLVVSEEPGNIHEETIAGQGEEKSELSEEVEVSESGGESEDANEFEKLVQSDEVNLESQSGINESELSYEYSSEEKDETTTRSDEVTEEYTDYGSTESSDETVSGESTEGDGV